MEKYSYLKSINADYIDELMERYKADPNSVDSSWRFFFEGLELGDLAPTNGHANGLANGATAAARPTTTAYDLSSEAKVAELITSYRERGRLLANLDPLSDAPNNHPLLELSNFGLSESDLDRTFTAGRLIGMEPSKLRDILARLHEIYCSSIGVQYTHIQDPISREWLQVRMEASRNREALSAELKRYILKRLTGSEAFERFLHTRYVAQKRFSLEGGDALIPSLDRIIDVASELGATQIVMGMAHRGRLNVLHNIYGKKAEYIFTEFEEDYETISEAGIGDVKYHMGFSSDIVTRSGAKVHLSLAHNPSHLEFVNPVVEGMARAKQRAFKDKERTAVIPIVIHGDAAFAGQGVVYETLNLSQVSGYKTGGTIHIVINNQVGFTTDPANARSTTYATDVAKMLEVPIFHVNADDPEAVVFVSKLCTEFRQQFKKDVIIDLICYRKYGHNEGDEPAFTQPLMYKKIKAHPSVRELYANKLINEGAITAEEAQSYIAAETEELTRAQQITRTEKPKPFQSSYSDRWTGLKSSTEADIAQRIETGVPVATLTELAEKLYTIPQNFHLHPKLERFFEARLKEVKSGHGLDWGNAEALAYASLLVEGHPIRMTGQDVERGTFSHRHAVLHDFETGDIYTPFNHLTETQPDFIIRNSTLSEMAVLGFEYGWSLADPNALVIWEAQFGDFANGAQVIIDQFIASGEVKWARSSGLVMFLPHGYEGQGPEHSSARLERFLQLSGENNLSICNFTTPAQLFHALRRQLKRNFRKPMVVMTPKKLLRLAAAVSDLSELSSGSFTPVLDDPILKDDAKASKVTRVLLCSGKIYYELADERANRKIENIAIVRIEELYPWPGKVLAQILNRYAKAKEIVWVQEEPRNMGAWSYVYSQWGGGYACFQDEVGGRGIKYTGRKIGAAPTSGSQRAHVRIQNEIVQLALKS